MFTVPSDDCQIYRCNKRRMNAAKTMADIIVKITASIFSGPSLCSHIDSPVWVLHHAANLIREIRAPTCNRTAFCAHQVRTNIGAYQQFPHSYKSICGDVEHSWPAPDACMIRYVALLLADACPSPPPDPNTSGNIIPVGRSQLQSDVPFFGKQNSVSAKFHAWPASSTTRDPPTRVPIKWSDAQVLFISD